MWKQIKEMLDLEILVEFSTTSRVSKRNDPIIAHSQDIHTKIKNTKNNTTSLLLAKANLLLARTSEETKNSKKIKLKKKKEVLIEKIFEEEKKKEKKEKNKDKDKNSTDIVPVQADKDKKEQKKIKSKIVDQENNIYREQSSTLHGEWNLVTYKVKQQKTQLRNQKRTNGEIEKKSLVANSLSSISTAAMHPLKSFASIIHTKSAESLISIPANTGSQTFARPSWTVKPWKVPNKPKKLPIIDSSFSLTANTPDITVTDTTSKYASNSVENINDKTDLVVDTVIKEESPPLFLTPHSTNSSTELLTLRNETSNCNIQSATDNIEIIESVTDDIELITDINASNSTTSSSFEYNNNNNDNNCKNTTDPCRQKADPCQQKADDHYNNNNNNNPDLYPSYGYTNPYDFYNPYFNPPIIGGYHSLCAQVPYGLPILPFTPLPTLPTSSSSLLSSSSFPNPSSGELLPSYENKSGIPTMNSISNTQPVSSIYLNANGDIKSYLINIDAASVIDLLQVTFFLFFVFCFFYM